MPVKQITTHDVKEIVGRTVAEIVDKKIAEVMDGKLAELETKLRNATRAVIDDRLQSPDLSKRPDKAAILETVKNSFDDMDFVRQIHYDDSDDKLHLIIIHDHLPSASAFSAIHSRVLNMRLSLDEADIGMLVLHESDVTPRHMRGARVLFEKQRESRDTAGTGPDGRQPSAAPRRLDDPETLEAIRNSFDDMDFVRQAHYRYDADGFMLVIIHDSEPLGPACSAIHNRIVKIEDSLHNVFLRNWIIHESEDTSPYLDGAKLLFKR